MLCCWQEDGGSLLTQSFMTIAEQRHKVPKLAKRVFKVFVKDKHRVLQVTQNISFEQTLFTHVAKTIYASVKDYSCSWQKPVLQKPISQLKKMGCTHLHLYPPRVYTCNLPS